MTGGGGLVKLLIEHGVEPCQNWAGVPHYARLRHAGSRSATAFTYYVCGPHTLYTPYTLGNAGACYAPARLARTQPEQEALNRRAAWAAWIRFAAV